MIWERPVDLALYLNVGATIACVLVVVIVLACCN